jgi:class 3 adenylate cyclase
VSWTKEQSRARVRAALKDVENVEILDLVRETDLSNIPLNRAYRVQGSHLYLDITNAASLMETGASESERSHKRYLRYLHVLQRVTKLVFDRTDAVKVDFQNHRLHLVVHKPYDDEKKRVATTVAVAALLQRVIMVANELHEELPDAHVAGGVESGMALAVNNGTRGDREPLFLGDPANLAAKLLHGNGHGLYMGTTARAAMGASWAIDDPGRHPLTAEQIAECQKSAKLDVDEQALLDAWKRELKETPVSEFEFQRPTPPLKDLDLESLTPANSRRLEAATIMADIDGFTGFIAAAIRNRDEATAVRVLHVARKELRDVLNDFGGRKVRYIGDCIQGVIAEGTSRATDSARTVTSALLAAGALRDAFSIVREEVAGAGDLGLGIGFDYGPTAITRLGVKGSRDRCLAGTSVIAAEEVQRRCQGNETGISDGAFDVAPDAVRQVFSTNRIQPDLTYNKIVRLLRSHDPNAVDGYEITPSAPAVITPRAHARQ